MPDSTGRSSSEDRPLSVGRSTLLFASGTLLSRLTGLARATIVVGVFGASGVLDAFIVAFRIPNLLREMLAEGALGSAFTKVYASIASEDAERAERLLIDSLYLAAMVSFFVCSLGILGAPWLVKVMTLMSSSQEHSAQLVKDATGLTRLLFPYLAFTSLGAIVMGALHQRGRFFLTAVAPAAFNVSFIVGALWFSQLLEQRGPSWVETVFASPGITGLAIGVLLGGLLQFSVEFLGLWRPVLSKARWRRSGFPWSKDVVNVLTLMAPAVIATSAGPINQFVNTNFATSLQEGAVTWLAYAFQLLHLPVGLFGVAVGVVVLPSLAKLITQEGKKVGPLASAKLQEGLELVVWLMVPCLLFLLFSRQAIVELLFQHGRFTADSAKATADALGAYSFGLIAYGLIKVLTAFYYAVERTSYAMKVSLIGISVNLVGNFLLVETYGHIGLATTTSITLSGNALLLVLGLRRERVAWDRSALNRSVLWIAIATLVCLGVQGLCQSDLIRLDWLATAPLKLRATAELLASGLVITGVFGCLGMIRLRLTPTAALQKVQTMLRTKKR